METEDNPIGLKSQKQDNDRDSEQVESVDGELAQSSGRGHNYANQAARSMANQAGESSGNAASNRTTQKLEDASEATPEAATETSTQEKAIPDDLHALSRRGFSVDPESLIGRTSSAGVAAVDVQQLQNSWVKYHNKPVEREATWIASRSPQCVLLQTQQPTQQRQSIPQEPVLSAQPPGSAAIPPSPFLSVPPSQHSDTLLGPGPQSDTVDAGSNESATVQKSRPVFSAPHSPKPSYSDPESRHQIAERALGLSRQLSVPDLAEISDLWSGLPNDSAQLENLVGKDSLLLWNSTQGSLGLTNLKSTSLARFDREHGLPFSSLLQDFRAQRRNKSLCLPGGISWHPEQSTGNGILELGQMHGNGKPGTEVKPLTPLQALTEYEGHKSNLPEKVQLSIITAPSVFASPSCINKGFKPAFTLRVSITCAKRMTFKATVTAYALQKEQVSKMDQWLPSQHIVTDALTEPSCSSSIQCDGPENIHGRVLSLRSAHVDLTFNDLKFNNSSRMKPRWLVFVLTLPTDDLIFVQYMVPTVVMSRQCDQTPRALSILQGETPTRKRTRQGDAVEAKPISANWGQVPHSLRDEHLVLQAPSYLPEYAVVQQSRPRPADFAYLDLFLWPHAPGPVCDMNTWREAIQGVCRSSGLTRSFDQDDMHELAKMAGFFSSDVTISRANASLSTITAYQWHCFGQWFASYLRVLRTFRDVWMHPSVKIICGFSVTRQRAVQILAGQPEKTFLLRPSLSLQGTFVISVVKDHAVHHLAIDEEQLHHRSLLDWIHVLDDVQLLLDIDSGRRYSKESIFGELRLSLQNNLGGPSHNVGVPAYIPPTGSEALQHIMELSRRGNSQFSGGYGQYPNISAGRSGHGLDLNAWGNFGRPNVVPDNHWLSQNMGPHVNMPRHQILDRGRQQGQIFNIPELQQSGYRH